MEYEHTGIAASLDEKVLEYRVFTETQTGPLRRSSVSNVASATVNAGNAIAGATGVTATSGPGTLSLDWTAPAGAGTGYLIDYAEEPAAGQPLKWMRLERNTIFSDLPYLHDDPMAGTDYQYRVFAHPIRRGLASNVSTAAGPTAPATTAPGKTLNLMGDVINGGQIDLTWDAPSEDGGASITKYTVHVAPTTGTLTASAAITATAPASTDFEDPTTTAVIDTDSADTMYSLKGLRSQQTWQIAVAAHNSQGVSTDLSDTIVVTMPIFEQPAMPVGLVAESAIDSNLLSRSKRGVLLIWNHPEPPAGAEITKYEIERKVNDGEFAALVTLDAAVGATNAMSTFYTDPLEPKVEEVRAYQVRTVAKATTAATEEMTSGWAEVRFPADTMMTPGAPVLSAMKDADMPATQINLTWTGPDNAHSAVTGYIIERAYGDVMFLDSVMVDGAYTVVAHPNFAFSNHMEWWETLDCAGMLTAVGSSETPVETPAADSDQAMYCAHYDMTAPSNTAGTIMAGGDADMKIEEYFNKRYEVITDGTATYYMDTGLMEDTEYSYRIRASHGMDAGMWSNTAMAMTDVLNTSVTPPTDVQTCLAGDPGCTDVTANQVRVTWTDGANAGQHGVVLVDTATGTYEDDWLSRHETDGMVTFMNIPSGTYLVIVAAISSDFSEMEFAEAMVTVP